MRKILHFFFLFFQIKKSKSFKSKTLKNEQRVRENQLMHSRLETQPAETPAAAEMKEVSPELIEVFPN